MLGFLVQLDAILEGFELFVDPRPRKATLLGIGHQLPIFALAILRQWSEQDEFRARGLLEDLVHNLLSGLLANPAAAVGAGLPANRRAEHPPLAVYFGDR